MQFETVVQIDASAAAVWATLVDVERWPEWTASITRVELLDGAGLGPGARVRIKQPRMPAMVWQVTGFTAETAFTWQSANAGVTTVASHVLTPVGPGRVAARLSLQLSGALAPLVALLTGATARRYVQLEADGLKARAERR